MNNNYTYFLSYDDPFDFYLGNGRCTINSRQLADINSIPNNHYKLTFYDGESICEYLSNDVFNQLQNIVRNRKLKNLLENI